MRRLLAAACCAVLGATISFVGDFAREEGLRAPFSGIVTVAAAVAFVVAGMVGRGWRAIVASSTVAAVAVLGVFKLGWGGEPLPPDVPESCDPGCIPPGAAALMAAVVCAALTCAGILARRLVAFARAARAR